MNGRVIILLAVIAGFAVLTVEALLETGYIGIFEMHMRSFAGMQVLTDLVIACLLACIWMHNDAKAKGISPWPFILLTFAAGSFGPLGYLLWRELKGAGPAALTA